MLMRWIWHWAILVLGLFVVTAITPISYDTPKDLAWAALVLILANTFIRPILVLISLPLVLLSLGFFLLVINAIILELLPHFVHGFHVPGFFSALIGSVILSVITTVFGCSSKKRPVVRRVRTTAPSAQTLRRDDKVIDI
jgi:putative membrane protein